MRKISQKVKAVMETKKATFLKLHVKECLEYLPNMKEYVLSQRKHPQVNRTNDYRKILAITWNNKSRGPHKTAYTMTRQSQDVWSAQEGKSWLKLIWVGSDVKAPFFNPSKTTDSFWCFVKSYLNLEIGKMPKISINHGFSYYDDFK